MLLRDKAARQILSGAAVAIGGDEATLPNFCPSPTSSVSEASAEGSSKKRAARDRFSLEYDLLEHENKKMQLEMKKFELEAQKFEAEMDLKRAQYQQSLLFHIEEMELKQKEIDAKHQAIQPSIRVT